VPPQPIPITAGHFVAAASIPIDKLQSWIIPWRRGTTRHRALLRFHAGKSRRHWRLARPLLQAAAESVDICSAAQ
jgi:hypothetical protein